MLNIYIEQLYIYAYTYMCNICNTDNHGKIYVAIIIKEKERLENGIHGRLWVEEWKEEA